MTTIIITALIILALIIKVIHQAIQLNDLELSIDWEDTDKHPFINGDPCRCSECTDRYHNELTNIKTDKTVGLAITSPKVKLKINNMTEIFTQINTGMKTFENKIQLEKWILLTSILGIYTEWYDLLSGKTEKYLFGIKLK